MKNASELAGEVGARERRPSPKGRREAAVELGRKLREKRAESRLTGAEVAGEMGFTRSMVSSWEVGIGLPSVEHIAKLVWFYGTTFEYLCGHMMPSEPSERLSGPNG